MNGLEAVVRASNLATIVQKQMGPTIAMPKMLDSLQPLRSQFGFVNMEHAVLKGLGVPRQFGLPNFVSSEFTSSSVAKAMKFAIPTFNIPTTLFETLRATSVHHNQLFESLKRISEITRPFVHLNNLQFAMTGLSGQIAAIAAAEGQWKWLEDFEQVSEDLADVAGDIVDQGTISDDIKKKLHKLLSAVVTFYVRNKKYGVHLALFVSIAMHFMDVHQYIDFLKSKPEPATKGDVSDIHRSLQHLTDEQINVQLELDEFKHQITQVIIDSLKHEGNLRTTLRACGVFLKPNTNSPVLINLPADFAVTALRQNHKWIYVSFYDLEDSLPQTGWVLKKYLRKEKSSY